VLPVVPTAFLQPGRPRAERHGKSVNAAGLARWQEEAMAGFSFDKPLRPVLNGAGTMTTLGGTAANGAALAAAARISARFVEMHELHRMASAVIAKVCGTEAGCVTACVAAGLSVSVAATMTGDDLAAIEALPDTGGLKNQVVLQKGHNCHFSGTIGQMIRLSGAEVVEIGAVNRARGYQLEGAISERTTAGVFVVSHHSAPTGMIDLVEFAEICHRRGVPVIVDASAEYDLKGFIQQGADLVLYSAHKHLGGLTAGIIGGSRGLIRACYLQEQGIGRAMKVGKEGVASAIAVLELAEQTDFEALWRQQAARIAEAVLRLGRIGGVAASAEPDPTGNPIVRARLALDMAVTGIGASQLGRALAAGSPAIYLRAHDTDPASLLIDPCHLSDGEMAVALERIEQTLARAANGELVTGMDPAPNENLSRWPDPPPLASGIFTNDTTGGTPDRAADTRKENAQ
jgi:uncharacterized pyridoxal phosphate-dependent enzyme